MLMTVYVVVGIVKKGVTFCDLYNKFFILQYVSAMHQQTIWCPKTYELH